MHYGDDDNRIVISTAFPTAMILTIMFFVLKLCNVIDWD